MELNISIAENLSDIKGKELGRLFHKNLPLSSSFPSAPN
jgi:hypothetical protein